MTTFGISAGTIAIFLLLSFSAFFSGSETALMAIGRIRLRHLAKTKPKRTKMIEGMLRNPEHLIGTILLGNNLVNVAMSAIATVIAITLWGDSGVIYVTVILTPIILVFAEIAPKVYAKYFNERISLIVAPILRVIMIIFNPIVIALTFTSGKLLLLLGIDVSKVKRPVFTEEEVKTCIHLSWDDGSITSNEKEMLSRIFTLNDKTIEEVMVPRDKMTLVNIDWSADKILKTIIKSGYSRFPVYKGEETEIVGFIHTKDIIGFVDSKKPFALKKIIRPPFFVRDNIKIDMQLRSFQTKKVHQAVVLDKAGQVKGLITLEDVLEELVGSIEDEYTLR